MGNKTRWVLGVGGALLMAATSCSSNDVTGGRVAGGEQRAGNVSLNLVPVSGVTLSSVHYVVANGATPPATVAEGDLPTAGSASTFSFGLPLPVGVGYHISLGAASAETGDDITCAGAYGPFNVAPNSSSSFTLSLVCTDNSNGQILGGLDVKTDACPRLIFDYAVVTPQVIRAGSAGSLAAKAHDLDGKSVTYAWKLADPSLGSFSPVNGAFTTLICNRGGDSLVIVTASNGECSKQLTVHPSFIFDDGCGNGVVDPGETCDTSMVCAPGQPNCIPGSKCPSNCVFVCGNGVVEPPAEECEPKGTITCDDTCHFRFSECRDGFLSPGEVCDPTAVPPVPPTAPAGAICAADCSHLIIPECPDGIVQGNEQCDDNGPSPLCSNTCTKVSTSACVDCEQAGDCEDLTDNCLGDGAFTRTQQTQCYSVMQCIEASNCLDGTGTLGRCYCGALNASQCGAAPFDLSAPGAPNGACAALIQAGMPGLTSNTAILGGLTTRSKPAGAAMQRLNCEKVANDSACLDVCGFTPGGPAFP